VNPANRGFATMTEQNQGAYGTQAITDHEEIRRWAEERGGRPARVLGSGDGGDPGLPRIDFEDALPDPELERISWEEFFEKFKESRIAFLCQDRRREGRTGSSG
jgi:hypothetical protein